MAQSFRPLVMLAALIPACGTTGFAETPGTGSNSYAAERAERAKDLTKPYGWFTLIALDWLKPGVTTVGSAKDNAVVLPGVAAHLLTLEQAGGTERATAAGQV